MRSKKVRAGKGCRNTGVVLELAVLGVGQNLKRKTKSLKGKRLGVGLRDGDVAHFFAGETARGRGQKHGSKN